MQNINPPGNARPLHLRHAPRSARGCTSGKTVALRLAAALTAINLILTLLLLTLT